MRFLLGALQPDPDKQAAVERALDCIVDELQELGVTLAVLVAQDDEGGVSIGAAAPERVSNDKVADFLLEVGHDYKKAVS